MKYYKCSEYNLHNILKLSAQIFTDFNESSHLITSILLKKLIKFQQ